ncbi:MAG: hypothetical protein HKN71_03800, partial [Gemmatimonadetes bacterium]|nr:hypothetical protein [Gemmatimonadota bacterium]
MRRSLSRSISTLAVAVTAGLAACDPAVGPTVDDGSRATATVAQAGER